MEQPTDQVDLLLLPGETLLWSDRPDPRRLFAGNDVWLIPFSLLVGVFAIYWEAGALAHAARSGSGFDPFALWGLPFVVIGQYLIWGRFLYKRWDRHRIVYAVTSKRLLTVRGTNFRSVFLARLSAINQTTRTDGTGSLDFGSGSVWAAMWANTGLDWFNLRAGVPAFYDIEDVRNVYRLIAEARSGPG
ncbi:MAG: hypothetical protein ACHQ0J_09595 [Candidatus Dormibacterales bacterium]